MVESNTLVQAIVDWSGRRPYWEQVALGKLARGEEVDDEFISNLASLAEQDAGGSTLPPHAVDVSDFYIWTSDSDSIGLVQISDPSSVNALIPDGKLRFGSQGLTLVYGENASGKSGYARIVKKVTRSRHGGDVLSNVFADAVEPSARVTVRCGQNEIELKWPEDRPEYLAQVSFYDSECATRYITSDTDVAYRPHELSLLANLVAIADSVRTALEERRSEQELNTIPLPTMPVDTDAKAFVESLTWQTTTDQINEASTLATDARKHLEALVKRISNLEAADVGSKRASLQRVLSGLTFLKKHLKGLRGSLSDANVAALSTAKSEALAARATAVAAGSQQFSTEPVHGAGSTHWKLLWDAARRFSEDEAYRGDPFPVLEHDGAPGRCVLCHQVLSEDAVERFKAFARYVSADVERLATEAEEYFGKLAEIPRTMTVFDTATQLALQRVDGESALAHSEFRTQLQLLNERRTRILAGLETGMDSVSSLGDQPALVAVVALEKVVKRQIDDLEADDTPAQLARLKREEAEIRGRQIITASREVIEQHVVHLNALRTIDRATRLTDTSQITRCVTQLTRTHVSSALRNCFTREVSDLGLTRVKLADIGGGKGNLRHRVQLIDAVQAVRVDAVLSEGERSALGLAGFLTEVESDATGSAVVLDDPVSSLDHVRKQYVARRLVELAATRQVVIFTHDIGFVIDLKRAANLASVDIFEQWVSRQGDGIGNVTDRNPWAARMVGQRIEGMSQRLAEIRRPRDCQDPTERERAVRSWYQDLRLVWERALEEVVLGPVQRRGELELRPTNLKVFARFTDTDDREFQAAFTRCGERGSHDPSAELNRSLPDLTELEDDLNVLREWHRRVRQYAN